MDDAVVIRESGGGLYPGPTVGASGRMAPCLQVELATRGGKGGELRSVSS